MADYRDKLDEWREAARRKARELDEKYSIKDRVGEAAQVAQDAARRGAEKVVDEAERARTKAESLTDEFELRERARRATEEATRAAGGMSDAAKDAARAAGEAAREASETFRSAGRSAGERAKEAGEKAKSKAGDVFESAKHYYERAAHVYDVSARATRVTGAASVGLYKAFDWMRANPGQAVLVSLSIAGGVRLGASFPALDGVLLGAHPHWFTHSALPVWALQRAGKKFDSYLREREQLMANGQLAKAEQERIAFERKIVRYVGAPLLGAFSCAAGMAMWAQIFQPGAITGAPISWLLGGNPVLDGIWLFANGIVCFQQGYKFFMIAFQDQQDVQRIVREMRGLLPAGATA